MKDMSNLSKKCVVYASTPLHAISAVSAILTQNSHSNIVVKVLIQWPGPVDDASLEIAKIIAEMLSQFNFIESVKTVPELELSDVLSYKSKAKLVNFFSSMLGWQEVNEIYYSHDLGGYMYYSLASAFSSAKLICYGDSMGIAAERDEYLSDLRESKSVESNKISLACIFNFIESLTKLQKFITRPAVNRFRDLFSLSKSKINSDDNLAEFISANFHPDLAILIMPVGQSRNFLKKLNLKVCNRAIVTEVVNTCIKSCSKLNYYVDQLLASFPQARKFILLTENFAECSFIDFDREIKMYCEFIENYCLPGDVIFLKSHPGEILPRNQKIIEALGKTYQIVELSPNFKRYPIEIWERLVKQSFIISTGSTILNLKYLYDLNLILPLNPDSIEYWFPKERWSLIKEAIRLYLEPLKKLPNWDGNSILWNYD
jgi:hypothetical protein